MSLTGEPLNPSYLAAQCNRSPEEIWQQALEAFDRGEQAKQVQQAEQGQASNGLDAYVSLVHGGEHIADNEASLPGMCAAFEDWIARKSESERHAGTT